MKIKDYKAEARKLLLGNYGILIASQFIIYMLTYGMTFAAALMVGGSTALAISGNVAATSAAAVITAAVIAAVLIGMLFLSLGIIKQYLNLCRRGNAQFSDIFYAFRRGSHPFRYVGLFILMCLIYLLIGIALVLIVALIGGGGVLNFFAMRGPIDADSSLTVIMWASVFIYAAYILIVLYLSLKFAFAPIILIDKPGTGIFAALRRSSRLTKKKKLKLLWLFTFSFLPWALLIMMTLGVAALWIAPYISVTVYLVYLRAEEEHFPEESYGEASTEDVSGGHGTPEPAGHGNGAVGMSDDRAEAPESPRTGYEEAMRSFGIGEQHEAEIREPEPSDRTEIQDGSGTGPDTGDGTEAGAEADQETGTKTGSEADPGTAGTDIASEGAPDAAGEDKEENISRDDEGEVKA